MSCKGGEKLRTNTIWAETLANTIMTRHPNPSDYPYKDWCYPQGFVLIGFQRMWERTGDVRYRDYILKYTSDHVDQNGIVRGFSGLSLDDIMAGATLVWALETTGESRYRRACDRIREAFNDFPRTSDGGFWHARNLPSEMWVDGVFMGMMFLLRYGREIADSDYCFSEAIKQLQVIEKRCAKDDSGLLFHAWSEDRKPAWADPGTGHSPEVWSEGLGWYALILVETLDAVPATHPGYTAVESQLKRLLAGLLRTQDRESGLWYQVVDKGDRRDNWHDTSGSAMFVYSIQRAVDAGIVPPGQGDTGYAEAARRGYAGITSKAIVNNEGLVDISDACDGLCVQNSYRDYIQYPRKLNAKEAVAAFLWAACIMECR